MFDEICSSTDRERWLEARREGIGASDAAAILGTNPWSSALDVFVEKTTGEGDPVGEAAEWGRKLEPMVLQSFQEETGRKVAPHGKLLRSRARPWQMCTLDGVQEAPEREGPGVVEVKCTRLRWRWEDTLPEYVWAQVQHQLAVTGWTWGSVAVLFFGSEFRWMDFERHEETIQALNDAEEVFWGRVQQLDPPAPDASDASKRALARLYPRDNGETIELPGEFVALDERLIDLKRDRKETEEEIRAIENRIKAELKEATRGVLPNGVIYSHKTQIRKEKLVSGGSFRVLRRSSHE